jgi:hypothetical protein
MKLARAVTSTLALVAGATLALSANAATPPDTVLNFPLLHLPILDGSGLAYANTVGGKLSVTAGGGGLAYSALGELGVTSGGILHQILDPSLGKGESITFTFEKAVTLKGWDIDDFNPLIIVPDGTNKFALSVDGAAARELNFNSHASASLPSGKTFTFSYAGDNYFIDTLKFGSAVPEATTMAQLGLGLGMMGLLMSRRRGQQA